MKPYKLFHMTYLPLAAVLFIITCYYSSGFAEFEREKDLGKDLRINLPEYVIENKQITSIYDGEGDEGLLLYDSLAYSIVLKAPLSDKSIDIIISERRGWEHVSGNTYTLRRGIISEVMECRYTVGEDWLAVSYLYHFDLFALVIYPIVASISLVVIYVIMLIVLALLLFVRTRVKGRRPNEG